MTKEQKPTPPLNPDVDAAQLLQGRLHFLAKALSDAHAANANVRGQAPVTTAEPAVYNINAP